MEQLLNIKTIPIKLEYETTPMKFEVVRSSSAKIEIEREKGGLEIDTKPKRDIVEISKGPHVTPVRTTPKSSGEESLSTSTRNLKSLSQEVDLSLSSFKSKSSSINLNDISMHYKMDKISFDVNSENGERRFTPSSIDYTVSQYPDVIIEYIGDAIYVPPSSNPNYEEKLQEE